MSIINICIGETYRLDSRIGSGSYGVVYLGTNINTGERVGVKLELRAARKPKLHLEYMIYQTLAGGEGISRVHWFGVAGEYNALVLDILGPSLHALFKFCNRKFTLKTVLLLADQMLSRIEYLHSKNFIHRDIKPANFVMGLDMRKLNQVFMIDFGLAKKYRDSRSGKHISCIQRKSLTGSARFASINAHLAIEQSRRDDLESLGFTLVYFALGKLPWQGMKASSKKSFNDKILKKKVKTPIGKLCKQLPSAFATYLDYCRALCFDEKPAYNSLRKLFRYEFIQRGYYVDYLFDWTVLKRNDIKSIENNDEDTKQQPNSKEQTSPKANHKISDDSSCVTPESSYKIKTLQTADYI